MVTEIILAIISALAGGGLSALLMTRVNRRAKNVETDGQVAEQWRIYAEKIDERYEKLREEKRELWEKYNRVENQLVYYRTTHCEDVACPKRRPPLGSLQKMECERAEE